jgi:outer membrane protein TolC
LWETGHKLREKQYALEQARIDAEFLGTQLDLRTTQAYDQMNDAAAMVRIQQQTVAHAQESYDHTEANYQAGRATVADWLQAQMTLTQAQAELTDAQIAYRVRCRRYRDLVAGNK